MKIKFNEYIKTAKVGQTFYSCDTGDMHTIFKIMKNKTWTIERLCLGAKESEEVEWDNSDTDEIIY